MSKDQIISKVSITFAIANSRDRDFNELQTLNIKHWNKFCVANMNDTPNCATPKVQLIEKCS